MQQLCKKLNGWNFTTYKLYNINEYMFDFYITDDAIATLVGDDDFHIRLAGDVEYYDKKENQNYISYSELDKIIENKD